MESIGGQKRGQDGEGDAAPAKTPKQSKTNPPQTLSLDVLKKEWTPGRTDRMDNGILKLNKNTNGLCGGDWISASDGTGATLSCVVFNDGKYYGLTAGHIFDEAPNSDVYTFVKKEDVNAPDGKEEDEFNACKIGKIVSRSVSTDSVVFEFDDNIEVKPPRQ
ncbi:expressed unknown protein [Seminavis robusta]|uniref:Uncharacterized protein n=1 Tax=Seminavis robusta TaxID=568900 RepID=A0A9N8D6D4_9STRA|nr:expressed unknown protein [Seminavis robusta]|eukprot:Sro16_g011780.1 n/a (162) ;mRNA; r:110421-110906